MSKISLGTLIGNKWREVIMIIPELFILDHFNWNKNKWELQWESNPWYYACNQYVWKKSAKNCKRNDQTTDQRAVYKIYPLYIKVFTKITKTFRFRKESNPLVHGFDSTDLPTQPNGCFRWNKNEILENIAVVYSYQQNCRSKKQLFQKKQCFHPILSEKQNLHKHKLQHKYTTYTSTQSIWLQIGPYAGIYVKRICATVQVSIRNNFYEKLVWNLSTFFIFRFWVVIRGV